MAGQKSIWEEFFKNAGIPSKLSSKYAASFSENRMKFDMLTDLNKELLEDLGVEAIGDRIAILRHAKAKQAELRKRHSSSPEVVEQKPAKASKTKSSIQTNVGEEKSKTSHPILKQSSNIDTTKSFAESGIKIKKDTITSASLDSKQKTVKNRKTLSQRFLEYEEEIKRKKLDETQTNKEVSETTVIPNKKSKSKGTVFTIQVPAKPPTNISKSTITVPTNITKVSSAQNTDSQSKSPVIKRPTVKVQAPVSKKIANNAQYVPPFRKVSAAPIPNRPPAVDPPKTKVSSKVTLVPAQGKQLTREKPTSIFSRLEKTTKVPETVKVIPNSKNKATVFNRLGSKEENHARSSDSDERNSNVFSRLGSKLEPSNDT